MLTQITNIILVLLILSSITQTAQTKTISGIAQIKDGDSLYVNGQEIRLHGVDSPEWNQKCILKNNQIFYPGKEAVAWLKSFVNNKQITCTILLTDYYKRKIATCSANGANINKNIVQAGFAFAYRKYSSRYIIDEKIAQNQQRGLWRGSCQKPSSYRSNTRK